MRKNMRAERVRNNLTRQQVANTLKVSLNAVSRWETGESEPKASNMIALCQLYKCSPEYLMDMTDDRHAALVAD